MSARASEVGVALLGYGRVGSQVGRLLTEQSNELERAIGVRLRVRRALVRDPGKPRGFAPGPGVLTTEFAEIRDDPSIAVVAEVMGGLDPAERHVRELLAAGKPVATANKQLLARRGESLAGAAATAGVPLRFEAAVCGAVPIVRTICEALPPRAVFRIVGVVNGTTNYVLTRMEAGVELDEALDEARGLGFAEEDASEDVSGADASAKMALLASVAFDRRVRFRDVDRTGIEHVSRRDVDAARASGKRLRLVGEAIAANGNVAVRVAPTELDEHASLARVPAAFNEVLLEGETFGRLVLGGPGAGGLETATAVVADLLALARGGAASHADRLAETRKAIRA